MYKYRNVFNKMNVGIAATLQGIRYQMIVEHKVCIGSLLEKKNACKYWVQCLFKQKLYTDIYSVSTFSTQSSHYNIHDNYNLVFKRHNNVKP